MSKRLQVLFDEQEIAELQEIAKESRMTLAEWVRQALREARRRQRRSASSKHQAVRQALKHDFPTADMDEMLAQIERGYQAGGSGE
jgi:hypothetical protein